MSIFSTSESKTINDLLKNPKEDYRELVSLVEKKVEEYTKKLRSSEEKYRKIIESTKEGYFEVDLKGNFTFFNNALRELLGYSSEELMGMNYKSYMTEENSKRTLKAFNNVYTTGIPQKNFQYEIIRKDGKRLYGESSVNLRDDSNGNKIGFSGFMRDVTEKVEAERKLRKSENKLKKRIKELNCLYEISKLIEKPDISLAEFVHNTLELTRQAFKLPDIACVRIAFEGKEDKTRNFKETMWKISSHTNIEEKVLDIEAYYLTESQFLEEEIYLLYEVANRVKVFIERRRAEQKVRKSEKKYRAIIENMMEGYFEVDLKGNYTYTNDYFCNIIGISKEQLIGANFSTFFDERTNKELLKKFNQIYETGNPLPSTAETEALTNNGRRVVFEGFVDLRHDSEGNKVGFYGLVRDVTKRKNAEQKLKESEEKFRTITEQSILGLAILQDNELKYINKGTVDIIGYSMEEMTSWGEGGFFRVVHPEDREMAMEQARKKQLGLPDIKTHYQFKAIKKNGDIIWLELFSRTINYKGKPADLVTLIDVSEKKKAEQELINLNKLKTELLRRTSHELKTPLISIKGNADLLLTLHYDKLDSDTMLLVDEIKEGCVRLEDLIKNLLESSRLESGQIKLKPLKEDLSFLFKFCVRELEGLVKTRNQKLFLNIHDKLITKFEKERIYEVIVNLLSNAIKYTPPNGKIKIKSRIKKDSYIISIEDNGIGLTEEEKKQIFKQFGKIERYGQGLDIGIEGTGLGLYIAKKIVELHGGEIWVESKGRNKGSTFYFSLPITKN